ncbi:MAG: ABC transporter permease [Rhodothermales bacterium]
MLKTYLIITLRNLRRHRGYTAINIVGLSVGLAACVLILLYIQTELSFDRFNTKADRIVRITMQRVNDDSWHWALAPIPMAALLEEDFPFVEQTARITPPIKRLVAQGDRRFFEDGVAFGDPAVFDIFDIPVVQGDPATALASPFTVFISQRLARKYFGDTSPVGRQLVLDNRWTFDVAGVFADLPANSHLAFDFMGSFESEFAMGTERENWFTNAWTYALVQSPADVQRLEEGLTPFAERRVPEGRTSGIDFSALPLLDIHLYSSEVTGDSTTKGDIRYVYLFAAIAVFILLIACINYMNLATARAAVRAREVGVRKAVGAGQVQLIGQFLAESVLLSGLALVIAIGLVQLLLPAFAHVMDRQIAFGLSESPMLVGMIVLFGLGVGVIAGSYPAFYLSAFRPEAVLKGSIQRAGSLSLRRALVVFQLFVSVALIAATLVVYRQMHLVQSERPGFQESQLLTFATRGGSFVQGGLENELADRYDVFKGEVLRIPGVEQATTTSTLTQAGEIRYLNAEYVEGGMNGAPGLFLEGQTVDADFFETMGLERVAGNLFDAAHAGARARDIVVNETLVKEAGWDAPIGKQLHFSDEDVRTVIGVVKDFHNKTLKEAIAPMYLQPTDQASNFVVLRVRSHDLPATIAAVERLWGEVVPEQPFVYRFYDDVFDALYRTELRLGQLFGAFALLAIAIACLGLFGLAAFAAQQRTKEVGIRKILGASVAQIALLLSRDIVWLMLAAFVLASPVVYVGMERWLSTFAYRIDLNGSIFLIAGGVALCIALLTVSYQAVRAALADPVKSLRYE